jgi:hypothetical protein
MLLFGHLNHFSALVLAALGANPVRELGFMTTGALGHDGPGQRIVRAARGGAPFGVSSFGIWHCFSLLVAIAEPIA